MVVPHAKTLGTHKIDFDLSPLLQADGENSSLTTSKSPVRHEICVFSPLQSHPNRFLEFSPSEYLLANKPYYSLSLGFPATEPSPTQPIMSDLQERLKKLGQGARIGYV
ncbi:hypothetical protein BGZ63DRAFT_145664 [Mariannaea sp. PMI_226]|nr:hypothetical protein BGZ63DRAFT_145664 [Mariannaea sp. PMI_226]